MLALWDPFTELVRFEDALFSRGVADETKANFRPTVDIFEDEKNIEVKADLPGIKPEDIKINIEHGVLTLSGERKLEKEEKKDGYHRVERVYGSFTRAFELPETVENEGIEAKYNEGVLTVVLPKKPATATHKEIKVTH